MSISLAQEVRLLMSSEEEMLKTKMLSSGRSTTVLTKDGELFTAMKLPSTPLMFQRVRLTNMDTTQAMSSISETI